MSVVFFEGGAGTGKTTSLVAAVSEHLQATPLRDGQQVLGLTFMHGARIRLEQRLRTIPGAGRTIACDTIDSFAWMLVRRWRRLAKHRGLFHDFQNPGQFDEMCASAASLLQLDPVIQWVSRTHPLVVLDEMQDCRGPRLRIAQELSRLLVLFAAGDEFQDLAADGGPNDAVGWLQNAGSRINLSQNHRTAVSELLEAASAVREGRSLSDGRDFRLVTCPSKDMAAVYVANSIEWYGSDMVILSPTGPDSSTFTRAVLERLAAKQVKVTMGGKKALGGPYRIKWDVSEESLIQEAGRSLGLHDGRTEPLTLASMAAARTQVVARSVVAWAERRARLTGQEVFSPAELLAQVGRAAQSRRGSARRTNSPKAMTIHRAKNQEFENVVVLWPYEVTGSADKQRRMLYNGITRAKRRVLVLVQDTKGARLGAAPFSAGTAAARVV